MKLVVGCNKNYNEALCDTATEKAGVILQVKEKSLLCRERVFDN